MIARLIQGHTSFVFWREHVLYLRRHILKVAIVFLGRRRLVFDVSLVADELAEAEFDVAPADGIEELYSHILVFGNLNLTRPPQDCQRPLNTYEPYLKNRLVLQEGMKTYFLPHAHHIIFQEYLAGDEGLHLILDLHLLHPRALTRRICCLLHLPK